MHLRVTIPYTALLGCDDQPGEIAGYGPIPAAVARDLAAAGTWRRILTDPTSNRPLDYGTTRYRPPEHLLAGLVITRDHTCQFPGCRIPAHRCDSVGALNVWTRTPITRSASVLRRACRQGRR